MLMAPLDKFLPTLQFTPNLHFYYNLEKALTTLLLKFRKNPPTLL